MEVEADYYSDVEKKIDSKINSWRNSDQRYQTIDQRLGKPPTFLKEAETLLARGKYCIKWRGIPMMKDCKEMFIYQTMLNDIQPRTIIETGTYLGGSVVWFADQAKGMDLQCHVFTLEKFERLVRPLVRSHPGVTCITGDANDISELMPSDMLGALPHPWLVVEDCHVNVMGLMEHFANHMVSGDYFSIEDTNNIAPFWDALDAGIEPEIWKKSDKDIVSKEAPSKSCEKHEVVVEFLQKHKTEFKVDSFYTDMFGFNGTCSWDGRIKKM